MIDEDKLTKRWFRKGLLLTAQPWTVRRVWEPLVLTVKGKQGPTKVVWRKCVASIFISPEGKEYVRSEPYDPVHRVQEYPGGLGPVKLTRFADSKIGRHLARKAAEEESRARHARVQIRKKEKVRLRAERQRMEEEKQERMDKRKVRRMRKLKKKFHPRPKPKRRDR